MLLAERHAPVAALLRRAAGSRDAVMSGMSVVQKLGWLVARLRRADPVNVYIVLTSVGIIWVGAMGKIFYYNPLTENKSTIWSMTSFNFIRPWIKAHPVDAPAMKLSDLPKEKIAPGSRSHMKVYTKRFSDKWKRCGRSSSSAICWLMMPWWTFTHVLQLPRKFVQFLPPLLVSNLLDFLQDGKIPMSVGYKLMVLAALRMMCDKFAQCQYLFSCSNEGTQPAILGCQAMILEKLQTMSPRARCAVSSAEIQTMFSKMEGYTSALSMPGQARMLLDMASMPLGYFFLYRLYGLPAVAVSIIANAAITALTARVTTQKSRSQATLRELSKQQEAVLHELAANLPIWKFYGWSHFFIAKLDHLALEMQRVGRWTVAWQVIAYVLPSSIGPAAVLISVGINVLLGGQVELVKLLTAGQYISIITWSMTSITYCRQQWKDLVVECKNVDAVLELPDATPLEHTLDGSIQANGAAFGWPAKPPASYTVVAKDTRCRSSKGAEDESTTFLLQAGDVVESTDTPKDGMKSIRVQTADGKLNGWVDFATLKKLPEPMIADWPAPAASIRGVDLRIEQGELVLISGPVAAGKSTLMQSLVGNTERLSGELRVPDSVAFQPQSPILFDQTIRSNILFGIADEDANETWLQQSLEASTLSLDMDDPESTLHAKREHTPAGQKGSELSGGQQARVALARCIYAALAGAECLILDDPIKALDPATAAKCWDQGIKGTMAGKTRVVVVNSQMLPRFASDSAVTRLIIVDKDHEASTEDGTPGKIVYNGPPDGMSDELVAKLGGGYKIDFSDAAIEELKAADVADTTEAADKSETSDDAATETLDSTEAVDSPETPGSVENVIEPAVSPLKESKEASPSGSSGEEVKEEPKNGSIVAGIISYCKRMGPWIILSAVGMVATQAAELGLYAWYEHWAKDTFKFGFRKNYLIAGEYHSTAAERCALPVAHSTFSTDP